MKTKLRENKVHRQIVMTPVYEKLWTKLAIKRGCTKSEILQQGVILVAEKVRAERLLLK